MDGSPWSGMIELGPWTSVHGSVARSAAMVVVLLAGCAGEPPMPEPERPANVVILFADDLGYGSVSWTGGDIPTPNIDSIVDNGVGFTAGYMTAPVCNPSRHGLMTGRYQQRWGKEMNSQTVPPRGSPTSGSLPQSETTMATALKQRGYATGAAEPADVDGRRNHPLLGNKRNLYGGGIRIPYALQWKGRIPGGQRYEHPISSMDMFPTALAAAGADAPGNLDGVNLLPYLDGSSPGAPHEHLVWRSGHNSAVRKGPWKLLMSGDELVRLYNVEADIGESNDLSAENPEVVDELKGIFDEWKKDKDEPRESARKARTKFNGDIIDWHI